MKATVSLTSSTKQGIKNTTKSSWVEVTAGRDYSPTTVTDKIESRKIN